MTLGDFAAFNSYLSLLIFPIIMIGFMSNVIAQSSASYQRISVVLDLPDSTDQGTINEPLQGKYFTAGCICCVWTKTRLKHIDFHVEAGSTLGHYRSDGCR